jgi:UDP-N-acetylglucosamine 2-epimerase (non-hydrolysing)
VRTASRTRPASPTSSASSNLREVVVVFGTRPEAIKLGPVVHELRVLGIEPTLLCTAQHTTLLSGTPADSDLRGAYSLGLHSDGDVEGWIENAVVRIADTLPGRDAVVIVQGDTMSAYAAALAGSNNGLTLAHVEAGIRSHTFSEPSPEERFRVEIGMHAEWHFAPTETARHNLLMERVNGEVVVTGNTVVSALDRYATLEHEPHPKRSVLITMHRREFLGLGREHVTNTAKAVVNMARLNPSVRFVWPVHPGLRQVLGMKPALCPKNLRFIQPLPYTAMIDVLRSSLGLVSDSGGLSEEAATLGVPTAVMRNVTDRPEAVENGVARLFPPSPEGITAGIRCILDKALPRRPTDCFGTPDSAKIIARFVRDRTQD